MVYRDQNRGSPSPTNGIGDSYSSLLSLYFDLGQNIYDVRWKDQNSYCKIIKRWWQRCSSSYSIYLVKLIGDRVLG